MKNRFRLLPNSFAVIGGFLLFIKPYTFFSDYPISDSGFIEIFFNLIVPIAINITNLIVILKVKSPTQKAVVFLILPILFITLLNLIGVMLIEAAGILCFFQKDTPRNPKPLDQQTVHEYEMKAHRK